MTKIPFIDQTLTKLMLFGSSVSITHNSVSITCNSKLVGLMAE